MNDYFDSIDIDVVVLTIGIIDSIDSTCYDQMINLQLNPDKSTVNPR